MGHGNHTSAAQHLCSIKILPSLSYLAPGKEEESGMKRMTRFAEKEFISLIAKRSSSNSPSWSDDMPSTIARFSFITCPSALHLVYTSDTSEIKKGQQTDRRRCYFISLSTQSSSSVRETMKKLVSESLGHQNISDGQTHLFH